MERFKSNKLALETHLEELTQIIAQSEFIPKVRATLPAFLNWDAMNGEQKKFTNSIFSKGLNTDRTLNNSLFVSAVASFESFLTKTIESSIQILNENFKRYDSYDDVFLNRQIQFAGKMLSSIYGPPHHINIDFHKICKNIGTIYPDSTVVTLNPEISVYFRNILDLESFSKFFVDLNIKIDIKEIAKNSEVKKEFDSKSFKDTFKQLEAFINETIRLRNRIAHTGQSASDITREKLGSLISKLNSVAEAINTILSTGLDTVIKRKAEG